MATTLDRLKEAKSISEIFSIIETKTSSELSNIVSTLGLSSNKTDKDSMMVAIIRHYS